MDNTVMVIIMVNDMIPSGKHTKNYRTSPF